MLRKIEKTYIITFKDGRSTEDWHDYREEKLIEISDINTIAEKHGVVFAIGKSTDDSIIMKCCVTKKTEEECNKEIRYFLNFIKGVFSEMLFVLYNETISDRLW